jgi:hypothetical protein
VYEELFIGYDDPVNIYPSGISGIVNPFSTGKFPWVGRDTIYKPAGTGTNQKPDRNVLLVFRS